MKNLGFLNASKYCITEDGKLYSLRVNSFMRGWVMFGYRKYSITFDDGDHREFFAHRLVAEAYIENSDKENKIFVNHIDGDKLNNNKDNLEWVTPSENNFHAYEEGLSKGKLPHKEGVTTLRGDYKEESGFSQVNEEDVHQVCKLLCEGYRDVDISRMTDFPRRAVNYLRHKDPRFFPEVTAQYDYSFTKEERMSPELVIKICERLSQGGKVMEVAREFNLNRKKVGNIRSRKTFKDISKFYKW